MFLQEKNCKLSNPAQEKPVVTAASGALLVGFYGLWTLFALPGFRKVPVCLKVPRFIGRHITAFKFSVIDLPQSKFTNPKYFL